MWELRQSRNTCQAIFPFTIQDVIFSHVSRERLCTCFWSVLSTCLNATDALGQTHCFFTRAEISPWHIGASQLFYDRSSEVKSALFISAAVGVQIIVSCGIISSCGFFDVDSTVPVFRLLLIVCGLLRVFSFLLRTINFLGWTIRRIVWILCKTVINCCLISPRRVHWMLANRVLIIKWHLFAYPAVLGSLLLFISSAILSLFWLKFLVVFEL